MAWALSDMMLMPTCWSKHQVLNGVMNTLEVEIKVNALTWHLVYDVDLDSSTHAPLECITAKT